MRAPLRHGAGVTTLLIAFPLIIPLLVLTGAPCAAHADDAVVQAAPLGAAHVGHVAGKSVVWRSTYYLPAGPSFDGTPVRVTFAAPLPAGATSNDGHLFKNGLGQAVAIDLAAGRAVVASITEPMPTGLDVDHLTPPIALGEALQSVQVVGDDELRFEPDERAGFERRVGYATATDLSDGDISECETLTEGARISGVQPLYLRASTRAHDGVRGRFTTASERSRPTIFVLCAACIASVVGLFAAHRRLSKAAKIEVAEAALSEEFERLPGPR